MRLSKTYTYVFEVDPIGGGNPVPIVGMGRFEHEAVSFAAQWHSVSWKYDPANGTVELMVIFPVGSTLDQPDNITDGPHGFALACTDGDDDQRLVGITGDGRTFPFAINRLNEEEFAGATFSPDGGTLFVNIQTPGMTFAIWGPW